MSGAGGIQSSLEQALWAWHGRVASLMAAMPEESEARALLYQAAEVSLYESGLGERWRLTETGELVPVDAMLPEVRSA